MKDSIPCDPWNGCLRQIHLDFHNSPWIDDLLCDFDATALARRFKESQVNRAELLHPDLQNYFEAHLLVVLDRYPCDGLFLDMLVMHPDADWSDTAITFREKHGLMSRDALTHARYEAAAQAAFAAKFTPMIQAKAPQASIFHNAENRLFVDGSLGALARAELQTHFEIESLPSGFWSYHHFPRVARNLRSRKPWLGMTGRFQKMWGDFGGIKPTAALEYECFRSQALGGANSVGDQLGPRGTLDEGAYRLIGRVKDDRVIYGRGLRIRAADTLDILVDRVAPYFQRSEKKILGEPAVLEGENWIYFADPVFTDYRQSATLAVSQAFAAAMQSLIGPPRTGWGLKSTVRIYPLRKGRDLHLTLLHYLPERKAEGADIVAERLGFGGQTLRLPRQVKTVRFEPEGNVAKVTEGQLPLPCSEGRLLLHIQDFFHEA